jgi:multidrug resistance efflux pump
LDVARRDLKRLRKAQAIASAKAVQDAEAARFALAVEQAKLDGLQSQLLLSELQAPAAGVLAPADAQKARPAVGAVVQPGQLLFSILSAKDFRVTVRVPESKAKMLRTTPRVLLSSADQSSPPATATVEKVEFRAGPLAPDGAGVGDYVATVRADISRCDWTQLGQKVRVTIPLQAIPEAVLAPGEAITAREGRSFATLMTPEGPIELEVKTGATDGKHVEIRDGLKPGDHVVLVNRSRNYSQLDVSAR